MRQKADPQKTILRIKTLLPIKDVNNLTLLWERKCNLYILSAAIQSYQELFLLKLALKDKLLMSHMDRKVISEAQCL